MSEEHRMGFRLFALHTFAGLACPDTCTGKHAYDDEQGATQAAEAHNRWKDRHHDVEPYPCGYCNLWHTGRIMPEEQLVEYALDYLLKTRKEQLKDGRA